MIEWMILVGFGASIFALYLSIVANFRLDKLERRNPFV